MTQASPRRTKVGVLCTSILAVAVANQTTQFASAHEDGADPPGHVHHPDGTTTWEGTIYVPPESSVETEQGHLSREEIEQGVARIMEERQKKREELAKEVDRIIEERRRAREAASARLDGGVMAGAGSRAPNRPQPIIVVGIVWHLLLAGAGALLAYFVAQQLSKISRAATRRAIYILVGILVLMFSTVVWRVATGRVSDPFGGSFLVWLVVSSIYFARVRRKRPAKA